MNFLIPYKIFLYIHYNKYLTLYNKNFYVNKCLNKLMLT